MYQLDLNRIYVSYKSIQLMYLQNVIKEWKLSATIMPFWIEYLRASYLGLHLFMTRPPLSPDAPIGTTVTWQL